MLKKALVFLTLVALILPLANTSVRAQGDDILTVAANAGNFTTLAAAVEAAGLTDTLKGAGPFTVFAPTDEAFAKLPADVLAYLLADKELLTRVLTYHVVSGAVKAADAAAMAGQTATSVEGGTIAISVDGDTVKVNSAAVVSADIAASNGVIHAIDSVILPAITLPEVDPLAVTGNVIAAGSSTVYPVTLRMKELFENDGFAGTLTVDSVGTGAGFERFCVNAETDISNASRAIRDSEIEACQGNDREPLEFYVAIDALAVVVSSANTWLENLTLAELAKIFTGEVKMWSEVNSAYPAEAIQLFSPGTDSGTFDFFVEAVLDANEEGILNAPGIQLSENDNVLVQGVEGSEFAIGYFGYAYYLPNQDKLRAVNVEGITPNATTAETGTYPLSRPLYIYTTAAIMQEKPQVAAFVNYYLTNVGGQLGTAAGQIGYFPTSSDSQNLDKLIFLAATAAN